MTREPVKIKICGLTRTEDCQAVNASDAQYAGFVFAQSRRKVSIELAAGLIQALDQSISPVGVFVDESDDFINRAVREAGLSIVQLHGNPKPWRVNQLRNCLPEGTGIWQRIAVHLDRPAAESFERASFDMADFLAARAHPDAWLLDSCRPGQAGGTGETFDWSSFSKLDQFRPLVLAGGLAPDNVAEAIRIIHPDVVDTSSGIETKGFKDADKIESFCRAVRQQNVVFKKGDDQHESI